MRISKFRLINYVSFYDKKSEDVELSSGINFVIGKNNSGKTALAHALSEDGTKLARGDFAHRSMHNVFNPDTRSQKGSVGQFQISYDLSAEEVKNFLWARGETFWLPSTRENYSGMMSVAGPHVGPELLKNGLNVIGNYLSKSDPQYIVTTFHVQRRRTSRERLELYEYEVTTDRKFRWTEKKTNTSLEALSSRWQFLAEFIHNNIFNFDAERRISARAATNSESRLLPDASNLAQVLHTLRGMQTSRFETYVNFVREIFPSVKEVLFDYPENSVEVKLSYYEPGLEQSRLARSLSECGTGLGQVMAMLYVVVTSDDPRPIIIDEPQSYLHPGAVRKLLEIFQLPQYKHHQYILTTHSPAAIASVREKTVLLLERDDMISRIKIINHHESEDMELLLRSVGARLSDVFGMDNIIWVEGETDEECFPMILRTAGIPLFGTKILRLAHSGDFTDRKQGVTSVKLYRRLSAGEALLPPALAFVFDADLESDLEHVKAAFGKQVKFICRQNYESYLIDAEAIAGILTEDDPDHADDYATNCIQDWIYQNYECGKYYPKKRSDEDNWNYCIDGAMFISDLFGTVTEHRVAYDKMSHTPRLTKRILADNPNHFQEIVDLIKRILNKDKQPDAT